MYGRAVQFALLGTKFKPRPGEKPWKDGKYYRTIYGHSVGFESGEETSDKVKELKQKVEAKKKGSESTKEALGIARYNIAKNNAAELLSQGTYEKPEELSNRIMEKMSFGDRDKSEVKSALNDMIKREFPDMKAPETPDTDAQKILGPTRYGIAKNLAIKHLPGIAEKSDTESQAFRSTADAILADMNLGSVPKSDARAAITSMLREEFPGGNVPKQEPKKEPKTAPDSKVAPPMPKVEKQPDAPALKDIKPENISEIQSYDPSDSWSSSSPKLAITLSNGSRLNVDIEDAIKEKTDTNVTKYIRELHDDPWTREGRKLEMTPDQKSELLSLLQKSDIVKSQSRNMTEAKQEQLERQLFKDGMTYYEQMNKARQDKDSERLSYWIEKIEKRIPVEIRNKVREQLMHQQRGE